MMGAGKSSIGRCLQLRTGLGCLDTDQIVSFRFGLSIPEIFAKFGEGQFREAEAKALADLAPVPPAIIVTGGGIVLREENARQLKQLGIVVWLDAEENTLFERASRRDNRPLLQTDNPRQKFSEILQERASIYAEVADLRVDTTEVGHDEVADIILEELEKRMSSSA
ncbi:MAG: shikimate kinase [Verrucomicrobiota bacterium]